MVNMEANLGPLKLKNPVLTASGTFGFGEEYSSLLELEKLGALVVKGLTLKPRQGNPAPRIVETPAGMLNAIGLQNPGLEFFLSKELPRLKNYQVSVIVNVAGDTENDYVTLARELSGEEGILALELNLSCPNVKKGGILFGTSAQTIDRLVRKVRQACNLPLIVKLSPNVTDIAELARAAENSGADILSLVNTLRGMVIDITTRRPFLGNITGGLSGPAIRPVAVRMVYEVYRAVNIPIIGMGGIVSVEDALQFFMAGASAVAVGTANFIDPYTIPRLISGLHSYLESENLSSMEEIIGLAHMV
jgi:dihydroorotate dehydrogenase (NAD+) catalytic subunit